VLSFTDVGICNDFKKSLREKNRTPVLSTLPITVVSPDASRKEIDVLCSVVWAWPNENSIKKRMAFEKQAILIYL
jgi:hypothetical protein